MIQKKPQNRLISGIRKSITTVLILEVLAFAGTYGVWRRLNRDQGNSNIYQKNIYVIDHVVIKLNKTMNCSNMKSI